MSPTEIIDAEQVKGEIVAYLGDTLDLAQAAALAVKDDASAERATDIGVQIKNRLAWLKVKRSEVYEPLYQATERVRREYDDPIKFGTQLEKTLSAAVIKYRQDKRREEERLRLAAEADARRVREEAERKAREAEAERQRVIQEQEARERRRREEEAAEARRKAAEKKARQDAERARLQKEQDERAQRIKEEEDARLAKAQEAQNVGLPERVETILETPAPIAPIAAPLPSKAEREAEERRKQEAAAAEAKAEQERQTRAAEEDRLRLEEQERVRRLKEDADRAKAEADLAEASAAAQASFTRVDDRMRTNTKAQYQVQSAVDFRRLCKAVAEGRAPIEFLGYDPLAPEKFRASAIGKEATKIKNLPDFEAKRAEMAAIGITVWLEEQGGFKTEKTSALEAA